MNWLDESLPALIVGAVAVGGGIWAYWFFTGMWRTASLIRMWMMTHDLKSDGETLHPERKPVFPLDAFFPSVSGAGSLNGRKIEVGFGEAIFRQTHKLLGFFQGRMAGRLPGTVFIQSTGMSWMGEMTHVRLESVMFKGYLRVWAAPRNLAHLIMPPDFMAWYEDAQPRPSIYVSGDQCCVIFQRPLNQGEFEKMGEMVPTIFKFIEKSGALERLSEKQ